MGFPPNNLPVSLPRAPAVGRQPDMAALDCRASDWSAISKARWRKRARRSVTKVASHLTSHYRAILSANRHDRVEPDGVRGADSDVDTELSNL
jgi:hypothetical protein